MPQQNPSRVPHHSRLQTLARNISDICSLTPIFLLIFITALSFPANAGAVTFEQMLAGFDKCQFKDVYVDILSKKPVHPYLLERRLQPCELKKDMAYFCLSENYFGLPVYKLMVPAGTFDIHAIYIDLPISKSRKIIRKKFGTEYRSGNLSDNGEQPVLLADPADPNKSILMCNPRSQ